MEDICLSSPPPSPPIERKMNNNASITASNESHEENSSSVLPRSIRWKLQLGLLQPQPHQEPQQQQQHLQQLMELNITLLEQQYTRYRNNRNTYHDHLVQVPIGGGGEDEEEETTTNREEVEDNNNNDDDDDDDNNAVDDVDPLTAMLMEQQAEDSRKQELELKYKKERARRKRGIQSSQKSHGDDNDDSNDGGIDRETLNIIDKDLNRLPLPDPSASISPEKKQQRFLSLREILYIFAQQHKHIGYRQGMHEVASYLLHVVQQDQYSGALWNKNKHPLDILVHCNAYNLLECILKRIEQAFDVKIATNSKPLEDMTNRILQVIQNQEPNLYSIISSLPVPPQIYCTKWIRLLFSREVVGCQEILKLWDVFMQLVSGSFDSSSSNSPQNQQAPFSWMTVLETTAACRILLAKDHILLLHSQNNQSQIMHYLMNMEQYRNIQPLVDKLYSVLLKNNRTTKTTITKIPAVLPNVQLPSVPQLSLPTNIALPSSQNILPTFASKLTTAKGNAAAATTNTTITTKSLTSEQQQQQQQQEQQQQQQYLQNPFYNDGNNRAFSLQSMKQGLEQLTSQSNTIGKRLYNEFEQFATTTTTTIKSNSNNNNNINSNNAPNSAKYTDPLLAALDDDGGNKNNNRKSSIAVSAPAFPVSQHSSNNANDKNYNTDPYNYFNNDSNHNNDINDNNNNNSNNSINNIIVKTTPSATAVPHPHQLANKLGKSVAEIQQFIMSVERNNQQQHQQQQQISYYQQQHSRGNVNVIPPSVWEALADIESVRKTLLQQQK